MNNKYQDLAREAGLLVHNPDLMPTKLQKFAELLIRECAEMVRAHNEQFMQKESHYGVVSADILKHFGVEL